MRSCGPPWVLVRAVVRDRSRAGFGFGLGAHVKFNFSAMTPLALTALPKASLPLNSINPSTLRIDRSGLRINQYVDRSRCINAWHRAVRRLAYIVG